MPQKPRQPVARPSRVRVAARTRAPAPRYLTRPNLTFQNETAQGTVRATESYLRTGLKQIRKAYAGFDADQGFDARKIKHWPDSRIQDLAKHISLFRSLTSGESYELYILEHPRSDAQRAALSLHTSQVPLDPRRHPIKSFVIHTNVPKRARVVYREEELPVAAAMGRLITEKRLRVELREQIKTGALVQRDYLFREVLGFQPGTESTTPEGLRVGRILGTTAPWEQMVLAMERLVDFIPSRVERGPKAGEEAYYRLLSTRGPIGSSVPKHMLVERMQRWGDQYQKSFAEMLIGVRFQGDEFKAVHGPDSLDKKAQRRQARYREIQAQQRKERARLNAQGRRELERAKRKTKASPKRKALPKRKTPPKRKPTAPSRKK